MTNITFSKIHRSSGSSSRKSVITGEWTKFERHQLLSNDIETPVGLIYSPMRFARYAWGHDIAVGGYPLLLEKTEENNKFIADLMAARNDSLATLSDHLGTNPKPYISDDIINIEGWDDDMMFVNTNYWAIVTYKAIVKVTDRSGNIITKSPSKTFQSPKRAKFVIQLETTGDIEKIGSGITLVSATLV
jgi:hypothetical protein